jgi:hypothetical protein
LELFACGSLFGRATHADGSPAAGELLMLSKVTRIMVPKGELGRWRPDFWFRPLETTVDIDGRFRFDMLAPGTYRLILPPSNDHVVESGRATGPLETVLPGEGEETKVLVTSVVRGSAGEPVSLVLVRAVAADANGERLLASGLVNARGSFSLSVPMGASPRMTFTDLRGAYQDEIVHLDATRSSEPLEVSLRARAIPLPPLDGLVLGPRGNAVDGAPSRCTRPRTACARASRSTRRPTQRARSASRSPKDPTG